LINSKVFISQKNRDSLSFALTCVFYVILLICFAIIPVSKQKKYTEISVQLSSPVQKPVEKKVENTIPPVIENPQIKVKEPVVKTEEKVVEKPVEKIVAKTEPTPVTKIEPKQTEVKKTENSSTKNQSASQQQTQPKQQTVPVQEKVQPQQTVTKREVVYQKSIEELMAENAQKKKSNATWDDSIFGDEGQSSSSQSSNSSASSNNTTQNIVTNTFEGFAGSSSESQSVQTASESRYSENSNNSVSSSTSQALNKISSTKFVAKNSSDTIVYETSGVQTSRLLIYPSEPSIVIPESLENKIERTKTVRISFVVTAEGKVNSKTISIEPVGSLIPELEREIKAQIALWRFESGKSDGQATFNYSINVE
jgi:hypothetical protein